MFFVFVFAGLSEPEASIDESDSEYQPSESCASPDSASLSSVSLVPPSVAPVCVTPVLDAVRGLVARHPHLRRDVKRSDKGTIVLGRWPKRQLSGGSWLSA